MAGVYDSLPQQEQWLSTRRSGTLSPIPSPAGPSSSPLLTGEMLTPAELGGAVPTRGSPLADG